MTWERCCLSFKANDVWHFEEGTIATLIGKCEVWPKTISHHQARLPESYVKAPLSDHHRSNRDIGLWNTLQKV